MIIFPIGLHEDFYVNLQLFQSGTNLLEDSKSSHITIPQPSITSSGFNIDCFDELQTSRFKLIQLIFYWCQFIDFWRRSTGYSNFQETCMKLSYF